MAGSAGAGASVNSLLMRRFARLERDELAVVNAASVIGAEFDSVLLSACTQRPLLDILEVLDRAVAAGLVASSPDPRGRFSFAHPLLRTACYGRRSCQPIASRSIIGSLALDARDDDTLVSELARQRMHARHPLRSSVGSGVRHACHRVLANAHWRWTKPSTTAGMPSTWRSWRSRTDVHSCCRPGYCSLGCCNAPGIRRAASSSSTRPMRRELGSALALAEIVGAMAHDGSTTTPGAMDPEFVLIAEDALEGLGDDSRLGEPTSCAALATHYAVGGDPRHGAALSDEALQIARRLDDRVTLGFVLLARRYSGGTPLHPEQRLAIGEELVALGALTASPLFTVFGYSTMLWSHRELGRLHAHDVALDTFETSLGGSKSFLRSPAARARAGESITPPRRPGCGAATTRGDDRTDPGHGD